MRRLRAVAETHYSRQLRGMIHEHISSLALSLGRGEAADYPKYREQVGLIRGLNDVLAMMDNLDRED